MLVGIAVDYPSIHEYDMLVKGTAPLLKAVPDLIIFIWRGYLVNKKTRSYHTLK